MNPLWYEIALRDVGVRETPGPRATPRILEYLRETPLAQGGDSDETPWCAAFVNWALRQAGITGTRSAAARSFLTWGETRELRTGAVIVIRRKKGRDETTPSGYHVGFFVAGSGRAIRLLGGNQGDAVSVADFPLTKWEVLASRWPVEVERG